MIATSRGVRGPGAIRAHANSAVPATHPATATPVKLATGARQRAETARPAATRPAAAAAPAAVTATCRRRRPGGTSSSRRQPGPYIRRSRASSALPRCVRTLTQRALRPYRVDHRPRADGQLPPGRPHPVGHLGVLPERPREPLVEAAHGLPAPPAGTPCRR